MFGDGLRLFGNVLKIFEDVLKYLGEVVSCSKCLKGSWRCLRSV